MGLPEELLLVAVEWHFGNGVCEDISGTESVEYVKDAMNQDQRIGQTIIIYNI